MVNQRNFNVPLYVDGAKINAELRDGVLVIMLPKSEEAGP